MYICFSLLFTGELADNNAPLTPPNLNSYSPTHGLDVCQVTSTLDGLSTTPGGEQLDQNAGGISSCLESGLEAAAQQLMTPLLEGPDQFNLNGTLNTTPRDFSTSSTQLQNQLRRTTTTAVSSASTTTATTDHQQQQQQHNTGYFNEGDQQHPHLHPQHSHHTQQHHQLQHLQNGNSHVNSAKNGFINSSGARRSSSSPSLEQHEQQLAQHQSQPQQQHPRHHQMVDLSGGQNQSPSMNSAPAHPTPNSNEHLHILHIPSNLHRHHPYQRSEATNSILNTIQSSNVPQMRPDANEVALNEYNRPTDGGLLNQETLKRTALKLQQNPHSIDIINGNEVGAPTGVVSTRTGQTSAIVSMSGGGYIMSGLSDTDTYRMPMLKQEPETGY